MLASNLHWSLLPSTAGWAHFAASLIYLPIVAVAIRHGAVAATAVALAGGALQVLLKTFGSGDPWSGVFMETLLFVGVGWLAVLLARNALSQSPAGTLAQSAPETRSASELQERWEAVTLNRVVAGLLRRFGTPVASIEGAGWLLEDAQISEEKRREFVAIVRKEAHQLSRMFSEVLDFTRPRQPRFHKFRVPALVDHVIHFASPKDKGPTIVFEKRIPDDLPALRGDAEQIQQALLNMVMNAVQASPDGGRIEIAGRIENGNVVITVQDHGNGIPKMVLPRIFEPFFSTYDSSLGLGLTVAQQIVTTHRGKIAVDSSTESGTSISMILPVGTTGL
jgi:two-component system, NtrC family, sensor histidine kinase HydH